MRFMIGARGDRPQSRLSLNTLLGGASVCCACVCCATSGVAQQSVEPSSHPDVEFVGSSAPPVVIERVEATYPPDALEAGIDAIVMLSVTVAADGSVSEVRVKTSAGTDFDDAAVAAVKRWRFEPKLREGRPVEATLELPYRFVLPDSDADRSGGTAPGAAPAPLEPSSASAETAPVAPAQTAQRSAGPSLVPPRLVSSQPPTYPPGELAAGHEAVVIVHIIIDDHGHVLGVHVDKSAGQAFDDAALIAVQRWDFQPALRDGEPVAASVRVAVPFRLPRFDLNAPPEVEVLGATTVEGDEFEEEPQAGHSFGAHAVVELEATRTEDRGPGDRKIGRDVIAASPRTEGAEVLRSAPGLYMGRGEGQAVAQSFALRGFDADHGQDIALSVGGLPINLPSHIHGQGYADMGLLVAETVQGLRVTEGVYDPAQGDFAVAGSIDVELGVEERGVQLRSSIGSFVSHRQLALWAPADEQRGTFAAVELQGSEGFGQNRFSRGGTAIAQFESAPDRWRYRTLAIVHGARADLAGVLRRDDLDAGTVGFHDVYPDASARAQNALALRAMGGAFAEYRGEHGDNGSLAFWLGHDQFRVQSNFTGYTQRSQELENVTGRGDLIEQTNRTHSLGLSARYRGARRSLTDWLSMRIELGTDARMDDIEQRQNLLDAARSQTWDQRVDGDIQGIDLGLWGDLQASLGPGVELRLGGRGAMLFYSIEDALQNRIPATRSDSFIEGYRRSAAGLALGPRGSARVQLREGLSLLAAYGEGYRSPQARTLSDGERAPFTKVRSADLGLKLAAGPHEASLSGYWTELGDDVAFDAAEGRLERTGATRRLGAVLYGVLRPWPWLVASASTTYVNAELLDPPPATASEPDPPFEAGQNLPFVAPVVVRSDLGVQRELPGVLWGQRTSVTAGLGLSALSRRPLPRSAFADPFALLDASLELRWGPVDVRLETFNLLDTRYAALEYNFVSQWEPSAPSSRVAARHFSAGAPRTFMLSLGVRP